MTQITRQPEHSKISFNDQVRLTFQLVVLLQSQARETHEGHTLKLHNLNCMRLKLGQDMKHNLLVRQAHHTLGTRLCWDRNVQPDQYADAPLLHIKLLFGQV